jgi:hypothetical protein
MHPQLTQLLRAALLRFNTSLRTRLVRRSGSFSWSHVGLRQAFDGRATVALAPFGSALRIQFAAIVARAYSAFRAYSGSLTACGASPHPNYVLNRTVGDMLRSNQTISALGRLARRYTPL